VATLDLPNLRMTTMGAADLESIWSSMEWVRAWIRSSQPKAVAEATVYRRAIGRRDLSLSSVVGCYPYAIC
jgi:hypothetical protein